MNFNLTFDDLFELTFGTLVIDKKGNIISCGENVKYCGNVYNKELTRSEKIELLKNMPNNKYKIYDYEEHLYD